MKEYIYLETLLLGNALSWKSKSNQLNFPLNPQEGILGQFKCSYTPKNQHIFSECSFSAEETLFDLNFKNFY